MRSDLACGKHGVVTRWSLELGFFEVSSRDWRSDILSSAEEKGDSGVADQKQDDRQLGQKCIDYGWVDCGPINMMWNKHNEEQNDDIAYEHYTVENGAHLLSSKSAQCP